MLFLVGVCMLTQEDHRASDNFCYVMNLSEDDFICSVTLMIEKCSIRWMDCD